MVEVEVGGVSMWLTTKMTQRYGPVVQAAADAGVTPTYEVVIPSVSTSGEADRAAESLS